MYLKDYYGILGIDPSATIQEIKKAYRKLALQYHPDKNNNDPYAAAQFAETKEAYEVLTNPAKKEYYLQQRWYNQSMGKRKTQDIITPVNILKQALELEKYVSTLDIFRMDKKGLQEYILTLLPDSTIHTLKSFHEPEIIAEIVSVLIKAIHPLPKAYTTEITDQLKKLSETNETAINLLNSFIQKNEKRYQRDKYSILVIIAVTVILCLVIWLTGR